MAFAEPEPSVREEPDWDTAHIAFLYFAALGRHSVEPLYSTPSLPGPFLP
jgi:hypothetical protein